MLTSFHHTLLNLNVHDLPHRPCILPSTPPSYSSALIPNGNPLLHSYTTLLNHEPLNSTLVPIRTESPTKSQSIKLPRVITSHCQGNKRHVCPRPLLPTVIGCKQPAAAGVLYLFIARCRFLLPVSPIARQAACHSTSGCCAPPRPLED